MKPFLLALIVAVFAMAQAPPTSKPVDIPADRREAISQLMLQVQRAQIGLQATQLEAQAAVLKAQNAVRDQQAAFSAMENSLRKEFHAEGCDLTIEKKWKCPDPPAQPTTPSVPSPTKEPKKP